MWRSFPPTFHTSRKINVKSVDRYSWTPCKYGKSMDFSVQFSKKITHCQSVIAKRLLWILSKVDQKIVEYSTTFACSPSSKCGCHWCNLQHTETCIRIFCTLFRIRILIFLILKLHRVLNVACFLVGNSSASEFYMPTFRNTLSLPS